MKEKLLAIGKECIDRIPNLNSGGCGIYALELSRYLPGELVILRSYYESCKGLGYHYCFLYDGDLYDSFGIIPETDYCKIYKGSTQAEVKHNIDMGEWNSKFDRKYVPLLQSIIEKQLK